MISRCHGRTDPSVVKAELGSAGGRERRFSNANVRADYEKRVKVRKENKWRGTLEGTQGECFILEIWHHSGWLFVSKEMQVKTRCFNLYHYHINCKRNKSINFLFMCFDLFFSFLKVFGICRVDLARFFDGSC